MENLDLQQVKCPNCGANITSFNPFQTEVECPYCHQKALNPLITAKKTPIPERLMLFKTTEDDFNNTLVNALVEHDYVPIDVFDNINPGNVMKAYLPMFMYEGTYSTTFTCTIGFDSKGNQITNYNPSSNIKPVIAEWHNMQGSVSGNFATLCLAYEGDDIPKELREFAATIPYNAGVSRPFSPELVIPENNKNLTTLALNIDSETVWGKYGESMIKTSAVRQIQQQLSGRAYSNIKVRPYGELKNDEGRYMLAPFWFVYYTYKDTQYHFIMDGLGTSYSINYPQNQEEIKKVKEIKRNPKVLSWFYLLSIVLGFTIGWGWAIGFAVWWTLAVAMSHHYSNKQIRELLAASKAQRKAAAQRYFEYR